MKKLIRFLIVVLILLIAASYILIPSKISVSTATPLLASENGVSRFLLDSAGWSKWWSTSDSVSENHFTASNGVYKCDDNTFHFSTMYHMGAAVDITNKSATIPSRILGVALNTDSTLLTWTSEIESSLNPLTRFMQYQQARAIKSSIDKVIAHFRIFVENPENVYGLRLIKTSFKDTLLISTKTVFARKPSTPDIYVHVHQLEAYAAKNNAAQTGYAIYNILQLDSLHYQLMTALPVNKALGNSGNFSFKRMIPGSFIMSDVKGGEHAIEEAQHRQQQFFIDYRKTSMAMNFQMLITDRESVPDSAQWITRLYHPVY